MTLFEHELMIGKLTQMLHLKDLRQLINQQTPFTFAGMHMTESDNRYHIDQDFNMSKIEQIPSKADIG